MAVDLSTLMPQQRAVATTLDRPLFVSAGAGSGKTFTLTRRILWALDPASGPFVEHLDRVLAITFTKDAAAEIRERVRAALIEAGMDEEALSVDDAWISTIHGMCARILRTHALELGIDPEFSVIEETAADELMDQAVDHVLARAEDAVDGDGRRAHPYADLRRWYKLKAEPSPSGGAAGANIRDYAKKLLELSCALPDGMEGVHLLRGKVDFSGLRDCYRELAGGTPKQAELAQAALAALDAFESGPQGAVELAACMMACTKKTPSSSKAFSKEQVALLKAEVADAFINAYLACDGAAVEQLLELARAVEREYRRLKGARAVMDNNDLLRRTFEAFRDHDSIRAAYRGRFKLVMIDEFQDTDQQQVDLIGYLAGEGGRALCTVGDAQQSIYRFRGAEVEVFRRQQAAVAGGSGSGCDGDPSGTDSAQGTLVQLVRNFRSHVQILEYVAQVFDGRDGRGGLMPDFLDLESDEGRKDGLAAAGASRRQAVLVVGGNGDQRTAGKAAAIARRFRELADAGQPVGGMVLLLGAMTKAGVYARAFRAEGLDCVIAGGSVFADAPEVKAVRALVCALADPLDAAQGLAPLLASPMFALGAQEFLALATAFDEQTGETRRRNIEVGIMADDDAPGLEPLPLLDRARTVMRAAFARVGRDPLAAIARDVVNESGWFVRLEAQGPEGRAVAANVLKALDAVGEAEAQVGRSPRRVALAFDDFLAGKQAPGALNEEDGNAVRIMTVHASKGLEFPVVAVAECFAIKAGNDCLQTRRSKDVLEVAALPDQFSAARLAGGTSFTAEKVRAQFKKMCDRKKGWLTEGLIDEASASDSAAARFIEMRDEDIRLDLEERARLLYVAMTRARDVLLLAMDASWAPNSKAHDVKFSEDTDLTGRVLERILPEGAGLDADRLVFEGSRPGDFELVAYDEFVCLGAAYGKTVDAAVPVSDDADAVASSPSSGPRDSFTLAYPAKVEFRVSPSSRPERDSYSYSSLAASLHEAGEDHTGPTGALAVSDAVDSLNDAALPNEPIAGSHVEPSPIAPEASEVIEASAQAPAETSGQSEPVAPPDGDPTALGSAFHAAAQWMVETGSDAVPPARLDALCRTWGCTAAQRDRLEGALARWQGSAVRREALSWPCLRAEVPFFAPSSQELAAHGAYAEGAIDLLCTDPADPVRALVIDYKTGGSPDEAPDELQVKHALQAKVYADALHAAGYVRVVCRFVRVEQPDSTDPSEPQMVSYEF